MYMSATPRSARLSSPGEVIAILVASAAVALALAATVAILFFAVFIPAVQFGGRNEIPSDFPIYPGARLDSAIASDSGPCLSVTATWSTSDDAARVIAFYRHALATGPWTITDTRQEGAATIFYFQGTSGPARGGYLSVERQAFSDRTQISMSLERSTSSAEAASGCHTLVG